MISADHLKGLTAFVQAAEAGSFTLAAVRLNASKSGVAKNVSRLEERLGVRLVNRTTRSFALTPEGQRFYESCVRALAELESAEAALNSDSISPRGRMRIDIPVVFGRRWVVPVLLDLSARHPLLELEITLSDRFVDPIEEGIDLMVRIGELDDSATLMGRKLGIQDSVVCASPDYVAERGAPRTLDDLGDHACIAFGRHGRSVPWDFLIDGAWVSKPIRGRLSFNDHAAIHEAVRAGHGLGLLATWLIADDLRTGRLVRVLPNIESRGFSIHAIWPQTRQVSPRVRAVVDELVGRFQPAPPWSSAGRVSV
ncbi:transcriptional regulator, LysR family [Sphingobium sp. AP50]|uniref:LysR family transcriptional regulator n=1 Tax=Sphingobium sp. AP50 TaxID=1884369 RepID=UPI0008C55350|nr:LysR family transcriptional regulator [Sphingobium sp. AP50]SEJ90484.1 transcriptional regulator, LysR family [Sphingobium sp. AP50]